METKNLPVHWNVAIRTSTVKTIAETAVPNFTWDFANESTPQRPQLKHMNGPVRIKSTQLRKREITANIKGLQTLSEVRDSYVTALMTI